MNLSEWLQDSKMWTAIIIAALSIISSNFKAETVGKSSQEELIKMATFYQELCNGKQ